MCFSLFLSCAFFLYTACLFVGVVSHYCLLCNYFNSYVDVLNITLVNLVVFLEIILYISDLSQSAFTLHYHTFIPHPLCYHHYIYISVIYFTNPITWNHSFAVRYACVYMYTHIVAYIYPHKYHFPCYSFTLCISFLILL